MSRWRSGTGLGCLILLLLFLTVFADAENRGAVRRPEPSGPGVQARKVYRQEAEGLFLHFYENGKCIAVVRVRDGDDVAGGISAKSE